MIEADQLEDDKLFKYNSLTAIVYTTAFWCCSYVLLRYILREKNAEYCCRILSVFHGFFISFIGINQCFLIDWPFDHPEWLTTRTQKFLLVSSLGYFIHDLSWVLVYQPEEKLMLVHHIYSVIALTRVLFKGYSGGQACCALGSMELTNPFLQCRWFLRSEGYYRTPLFTSVELTFALVFFILRIVLGTFFFILIEFQPKNDFDFKILAASIYLMSWMFMINMAKYLYKKYGKHAGKFHESHTISQIEDE